MSPKCLTSRRAQSWQSSRVIRGPMAGKSGWLPETSTAYSPSAGVNTISDKIQDAENVTVIPHAPTDFGTSGGSYFVANWEKQIIEYPASDFYKYGGSVLVGSEGGTVPLTLISASADNKSYVVTTLGQ